MGCVEPLAGAKTHKNRNCIELGEAVVKHASPYHLSSLQGHDSLKGSGSGLNAVRSHSGHDHGLAYMVPIALALASQGRP